jgi:hypothetical protein
MLEGGRVVETGSYIQLLDNKSKFAEFIYAHLNNKSSENLRQFEKTNQTSEKQNEVNDKPSDHLSVTKNIVSKSSQEETIEKGQVGSRNNWFKV